jgi:hypothetical protein
LICVDSLFSVGLRLDLPWLLLKMIFMIDVLLLSAACRAVLC